jgi:hypothetical protein
MRYWIVGSQFGIYHTFEDCEVITFAVEVGPMDITERVLCPACAKRAPATEEVQG